VLKVYGFSKVNAGARGNTRDLRVLWALEEMQLPFELAGMDHPAHDLNTDAYRQLSPFEQIPAIDGCGKYRQFLVGWANRHLSNLERWLDGREYIATDNFTVADILMAHVLAVVKDSSLIKPFPRVASYRDRCLARPAWKRTMEAYCARVEAA